MVVVRTSVHRRKEVVQTVLDAKATVPGRAVCSADCPHPRPTFKERVVARILRRQTSVHRLIVPLAGLSAAAVTLHAAEPGYYTQPAVHEDRIIFVSEGDLWSADLTDAAEDTDAPIIAWRLTSGDGDETMPHISADGSRLAFTGEYDGNVDVYVMPIDGGPPKRLTFHPGDDEVIGWQPNSREVLFRSARQDPNGRDELWSVSIAGGMPQRFDLGHCTLATLSSTGRRIAFTPWSNEGWTWKHYRGGTAPDVWVGDLNAQSFRNLTDNDANELFPMWLIGRVFFISDRDGTANLWSDSPEGGDLRQHTRFARNPDDPTDLSGYDIRWANGENRPRGTRILLAHAGGLVLYDAVSDETRRLNIQLASDRIARRQRFAPILETRTEFALAPDGRTLVVGARGELLSIPVDGGPTRQLTRTSTAREWGATYLEDDRIVFISDQPGEQQIAIIPADGSDAPSAVTDELRSWLFPPRTSPDGRWIAFADKTLRLHVLDMHTLEQRVVDQSEADEITDYRFSPDSNWLAYTRADPNWFSTVRLYSLRTGRSFAVSEGLSNDTAPRWDPAGVYLYMLSNRHFDPVMGQYDFNHVFMDTTRIIAVPLTDAYPPPDPDAARAAKFDLKRWASGQFIPSGDFTIGDDDRDADEDQNDAAAAEADAPQPDEQAANGQGAPAGENEPAPMRLDTDRLAQRQFILPIPPGNYSDLEAVNGGVTYLVNPNVGLLSDDFGQTKPIGRATLFHYDMVSEEAKPLAEKIDRYALSSDRGAIAVPTEQGFTVISLNGEQPQEIDVSDVQVRVNTPDEWQQIFDEAWRLQRDFYWAPNMAGVDWPAMRQKYAALLPRVGTRADLNDLIGEMIGELGTSHTYIWGGESHDDADSVTVGLLGADIDARFRISRIISVPAFDEQLRSPLASPHLGVSEGDVILGVNGQPLNLASNIYELLQDQAGKRVTLTIADDADGVNRRNIEIETIPSELQLRYTDWVESNMAYVATASDGKIGYIHIPNMGGVGLSIFSRYFYPQFNKRALVIDIRDNGGGFVSQMIIERLSRTPIAYDQPRHGATWRYPFRAVHAHLAALIDQHAGSDGDIFPTVFRKLELGPLIGTRTWGGVVGIRADKPFVDLGMVTQPEYAWWEAPGGWTIENYGVDPDIEVVMTPEDRIAGRDPQLDRAIEYLMQQLEQDPKMPPDVPAYPTRQ